MAAAAQGDHLFLLCRAFTAVAGAVEAQPRGPLVAYLQVSATVIVMGALGFVLPGLFLSRVLRSALPWVSAFLISCLLLFEGIFLIGVLGFPVTLFSVAIYLVLVNVVTGFLAWRYGSRGPLLPDWKSAPLPASYRFLAYGVAAVGLVFAARAFLQPLSGWDTRFRWDYLAHVMREQQTFGFYPPLTPEDFRSYFYVDGIPPMVSFCYFWIYASAGAAAPEWTGVLVLAQFCCICAVAYALARRVHGERGGVIGLAVLVSSPLWFYAVVMGQETGLTTLSLSAMVYFLWSAQDRDDWRAAILAGAAAAVGALSREYGCAFVVCGLATVAIRRLGVRSAIAFVLTTGLLSGPWYLRNWVRCGNPFYSNPVGHLFSVNPVHTGILHSYSEALAVSSDLSGNVGEALAVVGRFAAVPTLLALASLALLRKRRQMLDMWLCVGCVVLLWLYSVGHTAGGLLYSMRVLAPAVALLAVIGTGAVLRLVREGKPWKSIAIGCVGLATALSAYQSTVVPRNVFRIDRGTLLMRGFGPTIRFGDWQVGLIREAVGDANIRVLAEENYLYAAARELDRGIEVVPVWSPEVRHLFEQGPQDPVRQRAELLASGIRYVLYAPDGLNARYLAKFAFYDQDRENWRVLWDHYGYIFYQLPDAEVD